MPFKRTLLVKIFDFSSNSLGDTGAKYIANVLKQCNIKEINLSHNKIGDKGL